MIARATLGIVLIAVLVGLLGAGSEEKELKKDLLQVPTSREGDFEVADKSIAKQLVRENPNLIAFLLASGNDSGAEQAFAAVASLGDAAVPYLREAIVDEIESKNRSDERALAMLMHIAAFSDNFPTSEVTTQLLQLADNNEKHSSTIRYIISHLVLFSTNETYRQKFAQAMESEYLDNFE